MVDAWVQFFFASFGRMGRLAFALGVVVVVVLFALYERRVVGRAHDLSGWLVHLVLLSAAVSLLAKRLHDRGRSGWWSAVVIAAFLLAWPAPDGWDGWVEVAVLVAAFVELALMPGRPGPNRFGPPLQGRS